MTSRSREEAATDLDGVFDELARILVTEPPPPARTKKGTVVAAALERFSGADRHEGWEKFNADFLDRQCFVLMVSLAKLSTCRTLQN